MDENNKVFMNTLKSAKPVKRLNLIYKSIVHNSVDKCYQCNQPSYKFVKDGMILLKVYTNENNKKIRTKFCAEEALPILKKMKVISKISKS